MKEKAKYIILFLIGMLIPYAVSTGLFELFSDDIKTIIKSQMENIINETDNIIKSTFLNLYILAFILFPTLPNKIKNFKNLTYLNFIVFYLFVVIIYTLI